MVNWHNPRVDSPLHPKNQLFSAMPKGGEGDVLTTMNNSMIPKIEEIFSYSDSVIDESVQDDISNDITYADKLVAVNGYIIVNNCHFTEIDTFVNNYLLQNTNYKEMIHFQNKTDNFIRNKYFRNRILQKIS